MTPAANLRRTLRRTGIAVLLSLVALAALWAYVGYPSPDAIANALISGPAGSSVIVVKAGDSIAAALEKAPAGATVLVEPGEYRERLTLKDDIRLLSLTPRGAVLRLPGTATDEDAAVVATDVKNAEISGFRIVGDAATPLGIGVIVRSSDVRLIDLEITGAARIAVDLGAGDGVMLLGSDIHDNPGAGLALRANASPRITHSTFSNNGGTEQPMKVEPGSRPVFVGNFFHNLDPLSFSALEPAARVQLRNVNWFPDARPAPAAGRRGR